MRRRVTWALVAIVWLALSPVTLVGQRPQWDQALAVDRLRSMLATEARGQPWDDMDWLVDIDRATATAREQHKPLLVYFFLQKPVGPAAAPC